MQLFDLEGKRVFVAGHNGMVGSACVRRLQSEGCTTVVRARSELDLLSQWSRMSALGWTARTDVVDP